MDFVVTYSEYQELSVHADLLTTYNRVPLSKQNNRKNHKYKYASNEGVTSIIIIMRSEIRKNIHMHAAV